MDVDGDSVAVGCGGTVGLGVGMLAEGCLGGGVGLGFAVGVNVGGAVAVSGGTVLDAAVGSESSQATATITRATNSPATTPPVMSFTSNGRAALQHWIRQWPQMHHYGASYPSSCGRLFPRAAWTAN